METKKAIIQYINLEANIEDMYYVDCAFYEAVLDEYGHNVYIPYSFDEAITLVAQGTHEFDKESIERLKFRLFKYDGKKELREFKERQRIFVDTMTR